MRPRVLLRLYVAGTTRSAATVRAVQAFVDDLAADADAELMVIDVLADPSAAERDGVLATPMLVRAKPGPERRVVGVFTNPSDVREALGFEGGSVLGC